MLLGSSSTGSGRLKLQWISPLQEWLYVEECSLATAKIFGLDWRFIRAVASAVLPTAGGPAHNSCATQGAPLAVARRHYHRAYMGALAETYALMGDQDNALEWYRKNPRV